MFKSSSRDHRVCNRQLPALLVIQTLKNAESLIKIVNVLGSGDNKVHLTILTREKFSQQRGTDCTVLQILGMHSPVLSSCFSVCKVRLQSSCSAC